MSAEEWQAFLDRLLVKEKELTRARDAGRRQLIVYHFTSAPDWNAGCDGCSWVADAMTHPAHLNARDTSLVMVSRAPLEKIRQYQTRMGWTIPWYSFYESDFNYDFGVTTDNGERHGASVFSVTATTYIVPTLREHVVSNTLAATGPIWTWQ